MAYTVDDFVNKTARMFSKFENRLELFPDAELELIAASGALETLCLRMRQVRLEERDADLFALREARLAVVEEQRKKDG